MDRRVEAPRSLSSPLGALARHAVGARAEDDRDRVGFGIGVGVQRWRWCAARGRHRGQRDLDQRLCGRDDRAERAPHQRAGVGRRGVGGHRRRRSIHVGPGAVSRLTCRRLRRVSTLPSDEVGASTAAASLVTIVPDPPPQADSRSVAHRGPFAKKLEHGIFIDGPVLAS